MLVQDAIQLVIGLAARKLRRTRCQNAQFRHLLLEPALVDAEVIRTHGDLKLYLRARISVHRFERLNLLSGTRVLFRQHGIDGFHDGGLAGLVLTVDDHDAGLRQLFDTQMLDAADVPDFQAV